MTQDPLLVAQALEVLFGISLEDVRKATVRAQKGGEPHLTHIHLPQPSATLLGMKVVVQDYDHKGRPQELHVGDAPYDSTYDSWGDDE